MQFVFAILAILFYAAIYAVGFIVAGIIELAKYIQKRKEESRKAAEKEAKRVAAEKRKATFKEASRSSVQPTEPKTSEYLGDPIDKIDILSSKSPASTEPLHRKNLASLFQEASERNYTTANIASDINKGVINAESTTPDETSTDERQTVHTETMVDNSTANPVLSQISDETDILLWSIIQALLDHHKEQELPTDEHKPVYEDNDAILGGIITSLIRHKTSISQSLVKESTVTPFDEATRIKASRTSHNHTAHKQSQNDALTKEATIITELALFNNVIYHIKLLGHEDPRFQLITMKAYEIISKFGDSNNFFAEIINNTEDETDFATEIIRYIAIQKGRGVSDAELIKRIRQKYLDKREASTSIPINVFQAKPQKTADPVYIETETSPGSRQLTAKSKIAHKHKAIQYANIIGGKLLDGYTASGESSFHEYIKKYCKRIADKGDCSITTEEFEPHRNIIATYKKSQKKGKSRTVATNIITPKHNTADSKASMVLKILDKLTSSRLPRYEVPAVPSVGSIVQREYKKTNPFDVYNDLVSSEYNPSALNDKRFSVLYQLILFISECVENGMSEDETLAALSTLRVVNKRDLNILRNREIRFKGLSTSEREMVLDSELCNSRDLTNLYIDLILHYRKTKHKVGLNEYIIGVLLKNYKDSKAAWSLLKYIYLKAYKKSNKFVVDNRWVITEDYYTAGDSHGVKDMNEVYYSLEDCFIHLKNEYDHNVDMTRYNFQRDNVTTDMLNEYTLKRYLPKRFDSKGRLCTLAMVSPVEAELFKSFDKRNVGDHTYVLFPVASLTTKDLYGLLLTVNKQKRKQV